MVEAVKLALRISTDAFDREISDLIAAALADLAAAGIRVPESADALDPLTSRAVITYCRVHFGSPYEYEWTRLKSSYDEQKAQLSMASGHTDQEA